MDRKVALAAGIALLIVAPAVGAAEQGDQEIVEGHTTYTTIVADEPRSISVIGDVRCHFEVLDVTFTVPPTVGNVDADCAADLLVFGSLLEAPDPTAQDLEKTGRTLEVEGPQGLTWTTTEWTYEADGETWRAWTTDVGDRRVDPESGDTYRFAIGVPGDAAGEEVRLRAGSPGP